MRFLSNRYGIGFLMFVFGLLLGFSPALRAQSGYGGQYGGGLNPEPQNQPKLAPTTPPKTGAQPSNTVAPPNPEEDKAYKTFTDVKPDAFDQQIQSGEQYLQKYPGGRYEEQVYARLVTAYFQKNQLDKMYAASDKALSMNEGDVSVLVLVGWVIPHNYDPNDPESDRRLAKAENYEKRAIEILNSNTMPKPENVTDEQFAKAKTAALAQAHSGLGLIYFRQQETDKSVAEMQQAVKLDPTPDSVNLYILAVGLNQLKRYPESADAYEKCAATPGAVQDRCKQRLPEAKKLAAAQPAPPK
jgi:tetratricopeptide (TPR) repeat protein